MAEEFLDGAKIAPATEEMRCEGMAERMGRGGFVEAERASQPLDRELDDSRRQRTASCPAKERQLGRKRERREPDVGLNRSTDDGQHRHDALAPAFARDTDRVFPPRRRVTG